MPRTKFTPHVEDIGVIKDFLKQVSWGSQCILLTWLDGTKSYLLVPSKYVLVPCHWFKFEQLTQATSEVASMLRVKPGLILHGDCSHHDCDRISWEAHKLGFVVYWVGAENQVRYGRMITRGLDGTAWCNPENWKADID